jgi:hypothetical protein
MMKRAGLVGHTCVVLAAAFNRTAAAAERPWQELCPGIEYARFDACMRSPYDDSKITVVRVDPSRARLRVLSATELDLPGPLKVEEWAERYDLAVVINVGMFAEDWRTHLGYLKVGDGHINQPVVRKDYRSVLVFNPHRIERPAVAMLDFEMVSIPELSNDYGAVVQNLRIIRNPGVVLWAPASRRWSEAALGLDHSGRVLFVFSRSPYTMNEFGRCLLQLPLDVASLQHLEGGGDAAMAIRTPHLRLTLVGSYESGSNDGVAKPYVDVHEGFRVPNVIAVEACHGGVSK